MEKLIFSCMVTLFVEVDVNLKKKKKTATELFSGLFCLVCLSFSHLSRVAFLTLMPCHCVQIKPQTSGMLLLMAMLLSTACVIDVFRATTLPRMVLQNGCFPPNSFSDNLISSCKVLTI